MRMNHELIKSVAEQMLKSDLVEAEGKKYPVRRTSAQRLRTVTFTADGSAYAAIEQNPEKPSRWGQLARKGHRVVQIKDLETQKYVAVAVDDKVWEYGRG